MKKRNLLTLIIFSVAILASLNISTEALSFNSYTALYGTYLNYNNSDIKDNGYALTGYGSFWNNIHTIELGIAQTHINYKSSFNDLDQTDFTASYSNYGQIYNNLSLKLGFHYISSDDDLTDNGKIYIADITYYIPYIRNYGIEVAYSNYNEVYDLDIIQISPHLGLFLPKFKNIYLELRGYYIHPDKEEKIGLNIKNFYSIEGSATYTFGKVISKLSVWAGQQVFAVKKGGFVVYNLSEKYKGGVNLNIDYKWSNKTKLGFSAAWNTYKELATDNEVNQIVTTFFVGFNF